MKCQCCILVLISILIATTSVTLAQDAPGIAGPLVGHTTDSSAVIWMYAPKGSQVELELSDGSEAKPKTNLSFEALVNPAGDLPGTPYKVTLQGLNPLTGYQYQVKVNGKADATHTGSFQTAPAANNGSKFRLAVTSCMKFGEPQASWNLLLAEKPDLHAKASNR